MNHIHLLASVLKFFLSDWLFFLVFSFFCEVTLSSCDSSLLNWIGSKCLFGHAFLIQILLRVLFSLISGVRTTVVLLGV